MSKSKKLILMTVALVALVAAVIGVIKYNEHLAAQEPEESSISVVLKNLFENDKAQIASIHLKTQEDEITLVPGAVDEGGEITWQLKGHEDWELMYSHSSLVSMASMFQVYKEIEADVTDEARLAEFGLKDPVSVVTVTLKDGTTQTVRIGNLSSDKEYAFCWMEGDNTVYACNAMYNSYATFTEEDLRQSTITTLDTEAELYSLFAQKKGEKAVSFEYDENKQVSISNDDTSYAQSKYVFKEPYSGPHISVLQDYAANVFTEMITPVIVETIDANCTDFEQYGLGDEPEYRETIVTRKRTSQEGGYQYVTTDYRFGFTYGEENQYIYFREGDSNHVMGVEASCLQGRLFDSFDYVNKLVYLNAIKNVQSGTITIGDETHTFSIKRAEAQTDAAESSGEEALAVYRVDDTLVESESFLKVYRSFLSIAPDYEIWEDEEGAPTYDEKDKIEFHFVYTDGSEETISYYRLSEFYYVTQMQDGLWFACSDTYIDDLTTKMQACLEAKTLE